MYYHVSHERLHPVLSTQRYHLYLHQAGSVLVMWDTLLADHSEMFVGAIKIRSVHNRSSVVVNIQSMPKHILNASNNPFKVDLA